MVAKRVFFLLVCLAPLPLILAPKPHAADQGRGIPWDTDPIVLRAVSNIAHTLIADIIWLSSGDMGEMRDGETDGEEIYRIAQNVIVADPYFFPGINYFATYLGSIHEKTEQAAMLYATARQWDNENVLLYFYEIVLRATYGSRDDKAAIADLAKEAYILSEEKRYMKKSDVEAMITGFILYGRDQKRKKQKIRDDLLWLLEKSRSEKRKMRIRALLDAIDQGN